MSPLWPEGYFITGEKKQLGLNENLGKNFERRSTYTSGIKVKLPWPLDETRWLQFSYPQTSFHYFVNRIKMERTHNDISLHQQYQNAHK